MATYRAVVEPTPGPTMELMLVTVLTMDTCVLEKIIERAERMPMGERTRMVLTYRLSWLKGSLEGMR